MARRTPANPSPGRGDSGRGRAGLKIVSRRARSTKLDATGHPAHLSRPRVRTLVVASGKGGVGKSHLAANLAVALGELGARVLLMDADFSQASLDLLLGLHPRYDLRHVLSGEKTLEEIVVNGPKGVRLIPASSGVAELANLDDYRRECLLRGLSQLDADADLLLIDTASGVSRQVTSFCLAADDVVVLTTPEMPAFSDAYGLIKLLHAQGIARAPHLLVSMANGAEEAEETAHRIRLVARRFLRLDLESLGAVPFDPAVGRAVRLQEPVVTLFPQSPAATAYRAIARRLWEGASNDPQGDAIPEASHRLEA